MGVDNEYMHCHHNIFVVVEDSWAVQGPKHGVHSEYMG